MLVQSVRYVGHVRYVRLLSRAAESRWIAERHRKVNDMMRHRIRIGSTVFVVAVLSSSHVLAADKTPPSPTSFSMTEPALLYSLADMGDADMDDAYGHAYSLGREDDVTVRQSVDSYSTLEDGQPGAPGRIQVQLDQGWETRSGESDAILFTPQLQYTPDWNDFSRLTQFTLSFPMEYGNGEIDGNADAELGWQQRWISEDGWVPTMATLLELRFPTGYRSSGIDGKLTGIVAKDLGPGTLYFNAFAKTVNGNNIDNARDFQWGLRAGYQWVINEEFAITTDYVHQSSEEEGHADSNVLEVSGEWHIGDNLVFGPGISFGLDDNEETPDFGAGFRLTWAF